MYHSQQQAPVGGHAQGAIPQGAYAQQGNFGMQGHHYQSYATGGYAPAMPMAYGGQQSYPGMYAGAAYQQQQYRGGMIMDNRARGGFGRGGFGGGMNRGGFGAPMNRGGFGRGGFARGGFGDGFRARRRKPFVGGSLESQKEWERQNLCCFHIQGVCKFGDNCRFSHDDDGKRACQFGASCKFGHNNRGKEGAPAGAPAEQPQPAEHEQQPQPEEKTEAAPAPAEAPAS